MQPSFKAGCDANDWAYDGDLIYQSAAARAPDTAVGFCQLSGQVAQWAGI